MTDPEVEWQCPYCNAINCHCRHIDEFCRCGGCNYQATWNSIDSGFALEAKDGLR